MGSCVSSLHKGSAMKMGLSFGSKPEKLVLPDSPVKDKHVVTSATAPLDLPINRFNSYGSKEESFFDSQPWLESDGEDDFHSVRGDFTPSRGSTPVHHSFSAGTPQHNKPVAEAIPSYSMPEVSPSGKKRLSDLFKDSMRENNRNVAGEDTPLSPEMNGNGKTEVKHKMSYFLPKSGDSTPYVSGVNSVCSSERTPNREALVNEKSFKSMQCCLPSIISRRSFSDRKKRMSPAAVAVNGGA
ncbi:Uncharacterized protein At3g27210 [Linum perenne]